VTGVRYNWTFDGHVFGFAPQGLDAKNPGQFSRQEFGSRSPRRTSIRLKEFGYFTFARDGKKLEMNETDRLLSRL